MVEWLTEKFELEINRSNKEITDLYMSVWDIPSQIQDAIIPVEWNVIVALKSIDNVEA